MRCLLIGATGQLGSALRELAAAESMTIDASTRADLDLNRPWTVRNWFAEHAPYDVVLNAAACTAVDACEADLDRALAVNALGPRAVAEEVARQGGMLVHVSTDYVFAGDKEAPYVEDDPVRPVNVYGRTKQAGEDAVREACPKHFIVRTSWLFSAKGRNFVTSILQAAQDGGKVCVVTDQTGCPTYAPDLAAMIQRLIRTREYGTYHAANAGVCSWFDLAGAALEAAGFACRPVPITTADYRKTHPEAVVRPMQSALDCSRIERVTGRRMRPWQEALADCIACWKKENDARS